MRKARRKGARGAKGVEEKERVSFSYAGKRHDALVWYVLQ